MKIVCVGGGPAGLYFSILAKRSDAEHEVVVLERNRPGDTYGFGVVFSDATLEELAAADRESYEAITRSFHHWDDIDIHYRGERLTSTGHGFSGLSRATLLQILETRARALGVELRHGVEVEAEEPYAEADLILAADGVNSRLRARYADAFGPRVDARPNRFVWLGTTKPFSAFTFHFRETEHGLWRVHAYQYRPAAPGSEAISTFIVETTEDTWRAAGMDSASEPETVRFLERMFAEELGPHRLVGNRSIWRGFPTVRNRSWRRGNIVLVGDAAHSAHFSIGSGTRLAMIDAISLHESLVAHDFEIAPALEAYETARRPEVESVQRAAQASLEWFEGTERFMETEPIQFAFNLITRSLRITAFQPRAARPGVHRACRSLVCGASRRRGGNIFGRKRRGPASAPRAVSGTGARTKESGRRLRHVPVLGGGRHARRLAPRESRQPGDRRGRTCDVGDDRRESGGPHFTRLHRHVCPRPRRRVEADRRLRAPSLRCRNRDAARARWSEGVDPSFVGGDNEPLQDDGWPIMAASPVPWFEHSPVPREMTRTDMDQVTGQFRRAAEMSEEAGFDLLEIHFAHGYLLASFVSPLTNLREDEYGGDVDDGCASPSTYSRPCGRCGRPRNPFLCGYRRSTGRRAG